MKNRFLLAWAIAATLTAAVIGIDAQAPSPKKPANAGASLTIDESLPLTCEQAWIAAGKSYAPMLAIVKTLARVSLANRNLTFPNTREAGVEVGKGIAADCKADPNALLFAIVDKHVRRVLESH